MTDEATALELCGERKRRVEVVRRVAHSAMISTGLVSGEAAEPPARRHPR